MIFPVGSFINGLAIMAGALLGLAFGSRMPEKMRELIFQGIGLCILVLGLQSALKGNNAIITIGSIVTGSILGELLRIEDRLVGLSDKLKKLVGSSNPQFTEGFVTGSLLFCIGAMGILASIEEGLQGVRDIVHAKALIDFFAAIILAASLGFGVFFSGISVFIYQGIIVIAASLLVSLFTDPVLTEISTTGGILMLAIATNMLKLTHIRIGNMLPSLVMATFFAIYWPYF